MCWLNLQGAFAFAFAYQLAMPLAPLKETCTQRSHSVATLVIGYNIYNSETERQLQMNIEKIF